MKLSLILEAENRTGRPLDKFRNDVRDAGRQTGKTGASLRTMAGDMDRADRASDRAGSAIGAMGRRMDRADASARRLGLSGLTMGQRMATGARMGGAALVAMERRMQLSDAAMTALAVRGAGILGGAIRGGVITGGTAGAALAAGGLYKVVTAGMQAENFMTQLVGIEGGNAALAKRDMEWITNFAKNTPYDLAQVTQAFISARNGGINPMNGSLMALSDSAAALGKTFDDAIGMLADAKTEQFERMREFGITPNQKDGKVMLRYVDRLGRDMVKIVNKNGAEVERATLAILNQKFGGGGAALARTTLGKWDAITDRISQQAVKIWQSGFGDEVQRQLDRAGKAFDDAEQSGSADRWAQSTSQALAGVVKMLGDADWEGFGRDVKGLASTFGELAVMAGWAAGKLGELRKWMADKELQADKYSGLLGGIGFDKNGVFGYHPPEWAQWPKANKPAPSGFAPYKSARDKQAAGKLPVRDTNQVPFIDASEPQSRPSRDQIWRDALRQRNRTPPAPLKIAPAKPVAPPTGKISIDVKAKDGTAAKVTKVAAKGLDIEVNTGRAMGSFA